MVYMVNDNLIGGFSPPLWKIWLRQMGWLIIPNCMEKYIQMFQTTNQQVLVDWKIGSFESIPKVVYLLRPSQVVWINPWTLWTLFSSQVLLGFSSPVWVGIFDG